MFEAVSRRQFDRREFLRRSSLACVSLFPLACHTERLWARDTTNSDRLQESKPLSVPELSTNRSVRNLPPVHVENNRELRTTVGLRPYRPSGFVVRAEKVNDTLVIHNYGHGGAGITLSWGTAQLAMQLGCDGYAGPVAVLGSGAVGMATARMLQEAGFDVTIYTQALHPETTSSVAGGEWRPFLVADPNKSDTGFNLQLASASDFAYKRFQSMLGSQFGVRWITSYSVSKHAVSKTLPSGVQSISGGIVTEALDLKPDQTPFSPASAVRQTSTMLIEPPTYLPAMMDAFLQASGTVVIRKIEDRSAIAQLPEKLVFNCTGMGAKDIFGDDELTPVRGQLTFLKPQPEVDYAVSHDELYMLPRTDGILLGGTYELGMNSIVPDMDKKREILARHKAFFDSYRKIG